MEINRDFIEPSIATRNIHYSIREVTVLARKLQKEGKRILYLNIGDPNVYDFDLAPEAREAVIWAVQHRKNGYAPSEGLPEAIEAIEKDARERQHISNIVGSYMGNGASECIDLAITALANPGENILLPSPTYPQYETITSRLSIEARYYRLDEAHDWEPDIAQMETLINEKTRAIVVINPNNPTGSLYSEEILRKIVALAKKYHLLILNDEIYERLVFVEDRHYISLASLDNEVNVITFSGMSKAYQGPGIRIGWGIVSGKRENLETYYEAILRMARARLCASHPFQYAIKPCLEGKQAHLPAVLDKLRRRRDICVERISQIPGLSVVPSQAAFYMFVRVENCADDAEWCRQLLIEKGVVVVPGSGFAYREPNVGHFRIVYLPDEDTLAEAFDRISEFVASRANGG